jgi:hypothetical protein
MRASAAGSRLPHAVNSPMPASLPAGMTSLPPLGGRLLAVYRSTWWLLLAAAVLTAILSLLDSDAHFLILMLRAAKALVLIAVAALLFRRRQRDPVAALIGISFLLWTISSSGDFAKSDPFAWRALVDRLRFLPFALGLLFFPDGQWPRRAGPIGAAIVLVFVIGVIEALGLTSTRLYLPFAIGCVLAALTSLLARYRGLPEVAQQQLKWITLGLILGIGLILSARAGASLTAADSIPMSATILLEALFQFGIVVIALGFLTSLLRYRLYDAEAAISRSAVYAALTLTLVGTFAASEALIELVGQNLFGMAIGNVSGAVAAAIAAMMLTPLHGRISSWAEQHFQHDLAILKSELPDLLTALSTSASVKRLADAVLPRIDQALQATRIVLVLDGKLVAAQGIGSTAARRLLRGWKAPEIIELLDRHDEDVFPLRVALRCQMGSIRGWLLFGPRPDGSFYGRDDLDALSEVAPPLQRTLVVVAEREARDRARHRRDSEFRGALRKLTQRIAVLEKNNRR